MQKLLYFGVALGVGAIFYKLHIPAGWLLGSMLTGVIWSLFVNKLILPDRLFKVALAIIGGNIGFMVVPEQFLSYPLLLPPFILTLFLTILMSLFLGRLMARYTSLDANTAFFCCLPGGASEVIAISKEYGADQGIVAAFHTTRITLFVFLIPLLVGINVPVPRQPLTGGYSLTSILVALICLACIVLLTFLLGKKSCFSWWSAFYSACPRFCDSSMGRTRDRDAWLCHGTSSSIHGCDYWNEN